MADRGLLIVVSGPSGVGKDTVVGKLVEESSGGSGDFVVSISATTRPPREGELNGVAYHFMGREEFGECVARGEILEYAKYGGNYYGTPKAMVERKRAEGKHVILVIEVEGAMKIRDLGLDAVFVFLMPPSWRELYDRLTSRKTESEEAILRRLEIAKHEMSMAELYDYIIVNDKVEDCVEKLKCVVTADGFRVENQVDFVRRVLRDAETIDVPDH